VDALAVTPAAPIRTHFAPSPTGFLHLGGARTALLRVGVREASRRKFILRIEDTDVERSTQAAIQAILDAMGVAGARLRRGPVLPDAAASTARAVLDDMLERGLAYRCYTTPQELDALRAEQLARGEKPRYDGRWRPENLEPGQTPPAGIAPVFRFKNPAQGSVAWDDQVKGRIEINNAELDDLVLARADGTPTYNFGVVVDDLDLRITHVVRGDDHVNNTPRQINLIRDWARRPRPCASADGARRRRPQARKRHGAVSVMEYEGNGPLPDAMVNSSPAWDGATATTRCSPASKVRRLVRHQAHPSGAGALRPGQAALGQSRAHQALAPRGARSAARALSLTGRL
jgi:glutamyl-tRNA synthetase